LALTTSPLDPSDAHAGGAAAKARRKRRPAASTANLLGHDADAQARRQAGPAAAREAGAHLRRDFAPEEPLWTQLQQRLANESKGRHMNQRGYPTQLLDGLLVCAVCGDKTYVHAAHPKGHTYYQYVCAATKRGYRHCDPAGISVPLAIEAVLRQVERLRGQPWSDEAFDAAVRMDPNEPLRVQLRAAMANVEDRMGELARRVAAMQDVGPHFMEAMKAEAPSWSCRCSTSRTSTVRSPSAAAVQ
jgi:hypothetical protein